MEEKKVQKQLQALLRIGDQGPNKVSSEIGGTKSNMQFFSLKFTLPDRTLAAGCVPD